MSSPNSGTLINLTRKPPNVGDPTFNKPWRALYPFSIMISRSRTNFDLYRYSLRSESIDDIASHTSKGLTFGELCAQRALDLLKLKKDRWYLSYSGGIDSTAMFVAILQTWPQAELDKIVVRLTHHSIAENPTFYDRFVSKFPLRTAIVDLSAQLVAENAVLLTGEHGDQLFGSDLLAEGCARYGDQILREDYRTAAPRILDAVKSCRGLGAEIFEELAPMAGDCPLPIRTAHDFFWWFNFSQKWQHVKFRFLGFATWDPRARYGSEIVHFFDSNDFQKWSLDNHDLKIRESWQSYKFIAKEFIYAFTKDSAQLALRKIASLEKTEVLTICRPGITDDFRIVADVDELRAFQRPDV